MNPEIPAPAGPVSNGRFPPQARYIVGMEACERFSYYGMSSILTLYLKNQLLTGDDAAAHAKEIVHLLTMSIYFLPLLGGYLADRWWGRYNTIFYVSLFYCLGHGTLALFGDTLEGVCAGLVFIAIGAGGIKPCVSAFLGDQFGEGRSRSLAKAYGWFYWAVNFGALFGYTVIPTLRNNYGYGLAFGVPGIFMGIATLVFWLGRKKYVRVPPAHKVKQAGFLEILWHCVTTAGVEGKRFFDRALGRFTAEEVEGAKAVFRILMVFAPIPIFWALYWQVNTSWVIQAEKMIPFRLVGFKVDAETMQSAGALLVMIWVPVMTFWLYPLAERLGLRPTPLRRMGLGMILTAVAFAICGLIQQAMDTGRPMSIGWQIVPYIVLEAGEVLVSATALEFAFAEAPAAMKSTIMSFWFLTSSLGNFLIVAITAANRRFVHAGFAAEFYFYAVLLLFAAVIFALLAGFYRYRVQPPQEPALTG